MVLTLAVCLLVMNNLAPGSFANNPLATRHKQSRFIAKVFLDSQENAHIVYNDGKDARPAKEVGQVSCSSPSITKDRQTAGWLVNYDNHGITSYPIPLILIIYRKGRVIRKLGNGMSIGNWYFSEDSNRVAFKTDTVHGGLAPYYELHDIKTNRVVDKWRGPLNEKSPAWAKRFLK